MSLRRSEQLSLGPKENRKQYTYVPNHLENAYSQNVATEGSLSMSAWHQCSTSDIAYYVNHDLFFFYCCFCFFTEGLCKCHVVTVLLAKVLPQVKKIKNNSQYPMP